MKRRKTIIVALIVALSLFFPALSRGAGAEPANFLWELAAPGGGRFYILGSVHLAYPGLYPLNEEIIEAFDKSGALAVEIDVDRLGLSTLTGYIQANGLSKDPRPLPARLTPETRAALERSGLYNPALDPLRPWLAALTIQMEGLRHLGFEAEYGLDRYFLRLAHSRGTPVLELETIDDQMGLLAGMSDPEADLFLRSTILEMEELPEIMNGFLETWRRGDAGGFADIFFKEYDRYPELTPLLDKVIFLRNERLAEKIHELMSAPGAEPLFVVIGAGHLVGDRSVLTALAARGYEIKQK